MISDDSNQLDPSLLDELLANIATLSSVFHKPPEAFVTRAKLSAPRPDDDDFPDGGEPAAYSESPSQGPDRAAAAPPPSSSGAPAAVPDLLGDLIGLDNALVPVDQPAAPPL